jgi:plastocyanin
MLAMAFCGWGSVTLAAEPVIHVVSIENMRFSPGTVSVRPGDWIVFKNQGLVPHTVTEKATKAFDSAILNPGEQWKLVAPGRVGTLHYHCLLHPLMEGVIEVQASPDKAAASAARRP